MKQSNNKTIASKLWCNANSVSFGSQESSGYPHVSLATIATLTDGSAILLFSDLARHTGNIKRNNKVSVLVSESPLADSDETKTMGTDPLQKERITVHGTIGICPPEQIEAARSSFLRKHPASRGYIDFQDFNLYQFRPVEVFLVGGFGRIETFSAAILAKN